MQRSPMHNNQWSVSENKLDWKYAEWNEVLFAQFNVFLEWWDRMHASLQEEVWRNLLTIYLSVRSTNRKWKYSAKPKSLFECLKTKRALLSFLLLFRSHSNNNVMSDFATTSCVNYDLWGNHSSLWIGRWLRCATCSNILKEEMLS